MKIPTQIWIFCVGIFLQHYTFLQKRTFCILCEKFFHFVRKATKMKKTNEYNFTKKLIIILSAAGQLDLRLLFYAEICIII